MKKNRNKTNENKTDNNKRERERERESLESKLCYQTTEILGNRFFLQSVMDIHVIIIIIDNFCIALSSGVHKLTALYNILQHFLSFTNIIHIIMTTNNL